jgi:hypothetical protein
MDECRRTLHWRRLVAGAVLIATASGGAALPVAVSAPAVAQMEQAPAPSPRELQPRYEPVPPTPKSWYSTDYFFAATRGVANSTMVPGVKAPLFILTVPLDIVCLPFAAIGGFFG